LNRFISRSAERNLPFFEVLKQYLIDLTTLTPPAPGAPLLLYVAASHSAVSVALVQEKLEGQNKKQVPVYFVSEVLSLSKKNYTELEKVLYAVLMASRKLRHYFQAYHIIVPSSQPLKDIMRIEKLLEGLESGPRSSMNSPLTTSIDLQFNLRR
jgi:hypothetical protein